MSKQIPQLRMIIPDIAAWSFNDELPLGFCTRTYSTGYEKYWSLIISESFNSEFNLDKWEKEIVQKEGYKPERVFFIFNDEGIPCATASAMRVGSEQHGYVHYVGTRPAFSGRKLGYHVTAAVTQSFKREGCKDAVLDTDAHRIPAIRVYLKLGYCPIIIHEKHREIWNDIRIQTGIDFFIYDVLS